MCVSDSLLIVEGQNLEKRGPNGRFATASMSTYIPPYLRTIENQLLDSENEVKMRLCPNTSIFSLHISKNRPFSRPCSLKGGGWSAVMSWSRRFLWPKKG